MNSPAPIKRVALLFSGGPAPGANAVVASAASAFRRAGVEVLAIQNGYSHLIDYDGEPGSLEEGVAYRVIEDRDLWGLRNARGVVLGTARAHPGREVQRADQLDDPVRTAGLSRVCRALRDLKIDALVSIGGDGTLRTANLLHEYQKRLPTEQARVRVVHVPKTIDNDYDGIDFTFGFFTAVDVMGKELLNLRADAIATRSYFVVTTMGRKAGWLAYGVAVAGEAHMVIGVEDVLADASLRRPPAARGEGSPRHATNANNGNNANNSNNANHGNTERDAADASDGTTLDLDALAARVADLIVARKARGKDYGVVVLAEGLTSLLPDEVLGEAARDAYGHVSFATHDLARTVAARATQEYRRRSGATHKITGVQLGYESRCAAPHAFDVLLGTQLGSGAYRALMEEQLDGQMVSVAGQLELSFVPFARLLDPITLTTRMRFVEPGSDFHRLAQELGTRLEP